MGYYTEFRFRAKLKENTPKDILEVLDQVINNYINYWELLTSKEMPMMMAVADRPDLPIEHEFGKTTRWPALFHSNNGDPENIKGSSFNKVEREISIHSEFKDYDGETDHFIDWLTPFIDLSHFTEVWSKGEDCEERTIYKISTN